jgi:hypothetical protein
VRLEICIGATYCRIDDTVTTVPDGQRLGNVARSHSSPIAILTIDGAGEVLGLDQDTAR